MRSHNLAKQIIGFINSSYHLLEVSYRNFTLSSIKCKKTFRIVLNINTFVSIRKFCFITFAESVVKLVLRPQLKIKINPVRIDFNI